MAPDAISAHDVSVKILHRFRPEHSCPHHNIFKKRRAVCRLAFGFSGTPCFLVLHAPREGCRELSLVICFFLASQYICQNRECAKRSAKSTLSQSPVLKKMLRVTPTVTKFVIASDIIWKFVWHIFSDIFPWHSI